MKIANISEKPLKKGGEDDGKVLVAVQKLLQALSEEYGLNLKDPNFLDTPKRVAKSYSEIFSGLKNTSSQVEAILKSAFPCKYGGMVISRAIQVFSMCPHHLLPVDLTIDLAYIPSKDGLVLGISKLARLAEILAKRPVLQEQLTEDITTALMQVRGVEGAACLVEGMHYCTVMRGVNKPSSRTITSSVKGHFNDDEATRAEFFSLVRG